MGIGSRFRGNFSRGKRAATPYQGIFSRSRKKPPVTMAIFPSFPMAKPPFSLFAAGAPADAATFYPMRSRPVGFALA